MELSCSAAGAETTYTALSWSALAMITHPEVQRRAQAELYSVVGRSRVPSFSEVSSLPYIQAMVKDVLRWQPPLPFSVRHSTTEDDWYKGMFIPKGMICLPNPWECHHDPASYGDDAARFNPGRFLDPSGKIIPRPAETRGEGPVTFGFGKRTCIGNHVANDSLFIFIATALWAMNLERVWDREGKEILLDTNSFFDIGIVA
jgi:cytochrome P450